MQTMGRFLLSWELGGDFGHVGTMHPLALALRQRGHEVVFAVKDLIGAWPLLVPELGATLQAPVNLHYGDAPSWTMADILANCGYRAPGTLAPLAHAWKVLIESSRCDVVVTDYSPTAVLGAKLADRPAIHYGHGFSCPPQVSPLPVFRDWVPPPQNWDPGTEALVLQNVNQVLASHGKAPLQQLSQLFHPERTLRCTWPETDTYDAQEPRDGVFCGPFLEQRVGEAPSWPASGGPRVFAYLRAAWPQHAQVLRALDDMGCSTLCVMPDANANAWPVVSPRIAYTKNLLDLRQTLPDCALMVSHAGHGLTHHAIRRGVASLLLPTQTEQFLLARRVERAGMGINAVGRPEPVDYAALVAALIRPGNSYAAAAQALARKYTAYPDSHAAETIAAFAESLLDKR